jgi:hypothetical protein
MTILASHHLLGVDNGEVLLPWCFGLMAVDAAWRHHHTGYGIKQSAILWCGIDDTCKAAAQQ